MTKILGLVGATDKRVIAYPLIKVLMHLGRTLIVADDGVFRRFDTDYQTRFDYGNSEFIITPKIDDDLIEEVKQRSSQFEYVLFITTNEIPDPIDKVIYVRGINKGFATEDVLEKIEESEFSEVLLTFSKVQNKKALKITPSIKQYKYIISCEDAKEFLPSSDTAFVSMLITFFEKELDLPKNTLRKILAQK